MQSDRAARVRARYTIHGEKKPRGIVLSCSLPFLPTDERNLAYRAAELFYKETGALLETCEIHIEKRIPVAAGLAGGSTDAAAVLRALNALHTAGLTDDELCEMGLKLGADVPFCLRGGTMLAQGIGEELSLLPDMPHCWVVLCKPPFAVPTKEVYQEIDSVDILEHPDNKGMMAALNQGDYEGSVRVPVQRDGDRYRRQAPPDWRNQVVSRRKRCGRYADERSGRPCTACSRMRAAPKRQRKCCVAVSQIHS